MNLRVAQVVGLNTDQKAAQAVSSIREDEAFFALLQLVCDDAFTKGRLALSELSDFYFDFEGGAAEKLEATFDEAKKKFSSAPNFDILLSSISGKALYLIGQGECEVYLKRSDKLSPLLSIGGNQQIISGFLQASDRILLSTKTLINFLGDGIDKSLGLPLNTFEEEISSQIASEEKEVLAGLVIEVESEGEEEAIASLPEEEQYPSVVENIVGKVNKYFPKSGRGRLILAIVLVAVVAAGLGLQYKSNRDKERNIQFNQNLQGAKDEFAVAKGLSTLNPQEAKAKLEGAKGKVAAALSINPKSQEAKDLQKQIEQEEGSILQESRVSDFPLFLDLDLIKKDFKAQNFSLSVGKILLLDPQTKTLVAVDLAKKSHKILSGKDKLGDGRLASINGDLAFVYSQDKGIIRIDVTNKEATPVAKVDSDWGDIKDIAGFASNVYLLDTSQVWKYLPTADGYSDSREYLTKSTKVDFTNALRMQIESSVYVLKQGGEILRFTRGEKDHFSLGGLPSGVKDPKSFFVSSDADNLYLLDSGNSRLLILTKTGEYKGQITGDKFATATDLVVDEKGKKVYLLEGSKIYTVDLK